MADLMVVSDGSEWHGVLHPWAGWMRVGLRCW
jgi:hypothetical protein